MPRIILVRHGETHWNRDKRIQGHVDSPLTTKGIAQARRYGEVIGALGLASPVRFFSSPLGRCVETSLMLCESGGFDFASVIFDERLKEVGTGDYSGRLKSEIDPAFLEGNGEASWFFRCPGGESYADMKNRVGAFLSERKANETAIVVSHGVAGKVMRGLYLGLDAAQAMAEDSPQDAVFILAEGRIERIAC